MKGIKWMPLLLIFTAATVLPVAVHYRDITFMHVALYTVLSLILVTGATIDKYYFILPDEGAWLLVICGLCHTHVNRGLGIDTILYASVLVAVCLVIRRISGNGLGLGDIKWFGALALWQTPWGIVCTVYVSFLLGVFYLFVTNHCDRSRKIPFGPFLCIGGWCGIHFYNELESMYAWVLYILETGRGPY